jgi:putative transposase
VTAHPIASWTLQQLRVVIPSYHRYRFLIHDRDGIFSPLLDQSASHRGLRVIRSPPRSPKANSLCERVISTLRREYLDYFIPITELHLRSITKNWVTHYNKGRHHPSLGQCIPDPPPDLTATPQLHRHRIPQHLIVETHYILGRFHHDYCLMSTAA